MPLMDGPGSQAGMPTRGRRDWKPLSEKKLALFSIRNTKELQCISLL